MTVESADAGKPVTITPSQLAEACARVRREERARILAILTSELCQGRELLAHHLAFRGDLDVWQALDCMQVAGKSDQEPPLEQLHVFCVPNDESADQRSSRITRVGQLVGAVRRAKLIVDQTAVPTQLAGALLAAGVDWP